MGGGRPSSIGSRRLGYGELAARGFCPDPAMHDASIITEDARSVRVVALTFLVVLRLSLTSYQIRFSELVLVSPSLVSPSSHRASDQVRCRGRQE